MFTAASSSLTVNLILSPSPSWHDVHLFWRLVLKVVPSSSVRGSRWRSQLYFTLYHPAIVARVPAGIQNIPSNILLCHIVTGWAASIDINFRTKTYCNSNRYLVSIYTAILHVNINITMGLDQRDDKKHFLFPSGEADKIYIQPQQFVLIIIVGWSVLKQCSQ